MKKALETREREWTAFKIRFDTALPKSQATGATLEQLHTVSLTYAQYYFGFPRTRAMLRPTRLGNVLAAAEDYPYQLYRLNAVLWWPRLMAVAASDMRALVAGAYTGMVAMLNLSATLALLPIIVVAQGVTAMVVQREWSWVAAGIILSNLLIAPILATGAYRMSIAQAVRYGNSIRVAFDLYRHDILRQMRIPLPHDLVAERRLWEALNQWLYHYVPPWEINQTKPFDYDLQSYPSSSQQRGMSRVIRAE